MTDSRFIIECIGYFGSFLVVVSMLMSSVIRLRIINLVGSLIFMCYALIIHSYPTAVMNFALILINLYHLYHLRHTSPSFELVKGVPDEGFLPWLLAHYEDDIRKFFPSFGRENTYDTAYLVLCNTTPAGLFLAKKEARESLRIVLDYSTPAYRDCSVGRFLFDRLRAEGIARVYIEDPDDSHISYLEKMGFTKKEGCYEKTLSNPAGV